MNAADGCRRVSTDLAVAALIGLIAMGGSHARAQPSPSAEAQAVLERFLGEWQTQTNIHHLGPPSREFQTKGEADCRQSLGGRWFEFRSQSIPAGDADLQIMTYDAKAKVYRQWVFDSDGYHHEAEGTWDPSKNVLRWTGTQAGASFVIEDHWVSPDRLEWTLRRTGPDGKLQQTIRGTVERKKAR